MLKQRHNFFAMSVRVFLLPLLCLYFIFSSPVKLYEKNNCSSFELQEEPAEETEKELYDEEAALPAGIFNLALPLLSIRTEISDRVQYISENYSRGIHQPPEKGSC